MQVRALAIDLDGTLLTRGETISARNRKAVAAARAAGLEVIIATAGWYQRAEKIARQLDLGGGLVIACSGAQVRRLSDDADLMDVRMPGEFAAGLYRIIDGQRCLAWVALDEVVLMKAEGDLDLASLFPEIRRVPSIAASADAPPRIALVQGTAVNQAIVDGLAAEWGERVRFITSLSGHAKSILTLTAVGADKGVALEVACRDLGLAPADVVAVGDADNDMEMFRVAGGSFAMGQASPAVKAAARAVTGTNDDDGVAQAIERVLAEGDAVFRDAPAANPG
jgi:Cof subfamily protein (haloacid dehalogenase superfamily)